MIQDNQRIKILFVITGTGIGGAEKILSATIRGLDHNRYDISLCTLKELGEIGNDLARDGVSVCSLHMKEGEGLKGWFVSLATLFHLILFCIRVRPVIVHSFLFRANIISRIAAYCIRVPVIISSVRVMGGEKNYYHTLEKITSFMVDHYVTVSESVKNHLMKKCGILPGKITTIYNGVNLNDECDTIPPSAISPSYISERDEVILSVGRLHRQKGYDCLIEAVAILKQDFPSVKVLIVGEGEEENNLKNLIKSLDLTKQIVLTGLRRDIRTLFPFARLFVLPSLWEGMPNAVLEAMAAGLPVVATAVGGVPELVIHGETGMLVPPGDRNELARAMADMLRNNQRACEMGNAGRTRVKDCFTTEAMIERTERLYQEYLKSKKLL